MIVKTGETSVNKTVRELDAVTIRFCGDSGDGMQLAGTQFTNTSALFGNDVSTLPDFPAEIRAPAGTLAGVSGFQLRFSSYEIYTPGDEVDVLVAMNPAALRANLSDLKDHGQLIVNGDEFTPGNLKKAGYQSNPLEDGSLEKYQSHIIKITSMNKEALKDSPIGAKAIDRCKNFFALGLVYWLYGRPMEPTLNWIAQKFGKMPEVANANTTALKTGYYFGETTESFAVQHTVPEAKIEPGRYRKIMGNEALALGFVTAAELAGKKLFLGSYPITPASTILEELNRFKHHGVKTFQAEDEIAAMTSIIGASFTGALSLTSTSGPGLALKGEAMGLAVTMELPLVIINVQRGGPSTGLPTKTEQSDLLMALYGRHGECPMPVIAAQSPGDCFYTAIEASRIALRFMTPVLLLSDGYLANGSEPWKVPKFEELQRIEVVHATEKNAGDEFFPYQRDENLVRPWALPGTPGLEHRLGGLEKEDGSGNVCYTPANHQRMTDLRAQKVANIQKLIPPTEILGSESGDLLVVGWGGTYGSITTAVRRCREEGLPVSAVHLRYLNPLPPDLGEILGRFDRIVVPELNTGQLRFYLQGTYLRDLEGLNKVQGKPFLVSEICKKIRSMIGEKVHA
ncbi:MAG: 2-oxoacid:acceptor oxidoreductase subunit alpha [Planctomycetota bacterium]|nr:2-oxoacid:acceptor oxidoreductase subunit alpha [Planctomycetota bacterium]